MAQARESSAPSSWLAAWSLCQRELVRFYRQRNRVVGALASPLVFWLLIGSGLGTSFRPSAHYAGMSAIEYLYPGTLILILLFTAIFSTISVIEDRREGFLQAVLVAPPPRWSIAMGKILGGTLLAVSQGVIFLLLAPTLGIWPSAMELLAVLAVIFAVSFGLTGLGFAIAWRMDSTQGFHAIMNLFLIPLWLLSGALFPASGAPTWLRWVMNCNPLTYGVEALNRALHLRIPLGENQWSLPASLGIVIAFGLVMWAFSTWLVNRREMSAGRSAH